MDKWLKDILPDKDPYHNRRRDQMRKKGVRNSSACDFDYPFDIFNMCAKLLQVSDICIETVEGIDYTK
jgi:hypothetical protein